MGLALLLHSADPDSAHQTMQGTLMGTPDLISPEQAMTVIKVDIRADLYSLGCTFYFLLAGRPSLCRISAAQKTHDASSREPRPLRVLAPTFLIEIEAIVNKLCANGRKIDIKHPANGRGSRKNQRTTEKRQSLSPPALDLELQKILRKPGRPSMPGSLKGIGPAIPPRCFVRMDRQVPLRREGPGCGPKVQTLKGHRAGS